MKPKPTPQKGPPELKLGEVVPELADVVSSLQQGEGLHHGAGAGARGGAFSCLPHLEPRFQMCHLFEVRGH